ncbi:hypothetical protein BgiMline_034359 [Biomphalaria glabrata]|nr:hypothetical protein BgiMline_020525 [Biomphalaria glabrata]KAI8776120.1 hypothetical protein BgiBS90_023276 [Biomphalaria glabrata]
MDGSKDSFKDSLKLLVSEIETLKKTPSKQVKYIQRISDIESKFNSFHEEVTPKPVLSYLYTCVGRMKFYGDQILSIYLEVSDNEKAKQFWPAKARWKVELLDENNQNSSAFNLGESTCLFNKPRQGFTAHPSDWISIRYNDFRQSRLIGPDNSMTIRWTVLVEPVLQNIYFEQFEQLLINAERYFDFFNGGEIKQIKDKVSELRITNIEHEKKMSDLMTEFPKIKKRLTDIEEKQNLIDIEFRKIYSKNEQKNITRDERIPQTS